MFVGNGIGKLIERAVPDGRDNPKFQAVYDAFVAHYGAHSRDHRPLALTCAPGMAAR